MPTGRRRGTNRPKAKGELQLGDLVLAKIKGFPPWPAKICRPEDWNKSPDSKKYFVEFFGTSEIAFVAPADIQIFTHESKSKLLARCQGKTVRFFAPAVEEICNAFEKLQKRSNEMGQDASKNEMGSKSSLIVSEGKRRLKNRNVDKLKPDVVLNKSENEKDFGSIDELRLEPCSQGHKGSAVTELNVPECERETPVLSFQRNKSLIHQKRKPKGARPTVAEQTYDGLLEEEASSHLGSSHENLKEAFPESNLTETSPKIRMDDKDNQSPSLYLKITDFKQKEETNGKATSEISLLKSEVDDDQKVHENHGGHVKIKKLPLSVCASVPEGKIKSVGGKSSGDSRKSETHVDPVKNSGTLEPPPKRPSVNGMLNKTISKDKPTTEGKTVPGSSLGYRRDAVGSMKRKLVNSEEFPISKRSKNMDKGVDIFEGSSKDEPSHPSNSKSKKAAKNITLGAQKADNNLAVAELHDNMNQSHLVKPCNGPDTDLNCSITVVENAKTYEGSGDVLNSSSSVDIDKKGNNGVNRVNSKLNKSLGAHVPPRRRAVRYADEDNDDGEDCRTPIHRGTGGTLLREQSKSADSVGRVQIKQESSLESAQEVSFSNSSKVTSRIVCARMKESNTNNMGSLHLVENGSLAHSTCHIEEEMLERTADLLSGQNSMKQEGKETSTSENRAHNTAFVTLGSRGNAGRLICPKEVRPHIKKQAATANVVQIHSSVKTSGTSNYSRSLLNSQKNKPSLDKSKVKSSFQVEADTENRSDVNFSAELLTDKDIQMDQRSDIIKEANTTDLLSVTDFTSMRHLIAAAQAKRRQTYSQHAFNESVTPGSAPIPPCSLGRSPDLISATFSSGDKKWFQASTHDVFPPAPQQFLPVDTEEHEDYDRKIGTDYEQHGNSSSGATEAAVARDALEGMIETLSRTRDSIGRATRLAIDCAKYGIASEVVDLLIRKLEGEPSFYRRIDLFFLVDSITQCSHTQKGIAGSSYIPVIQAALPRLLGAAAPAGASARENRRQCLKVLKLWLERRILPESLLRHCMEGIAVSNDDLHFGLTLRRPSRAERSVDDPIREMEGMLVDEYGSNATFEFPGLFSAHVLEDDEDFCCSTSKSTLNSSSVAVSDLRGHIVSEKYFIDKNHHILEHVDQKIEMENAPTNLVDGSGPYNFAFLEECVAAEESIYNNRSVPSHPPAGSPPLPSDPPPTPPPLPPSPPPLQPPPPLSPPSPSPSPPPPPPPPQSPPPPPPLPPLAPLQVLSAESALAQPPLPALPHPYKCHPTVPQEYCRGENENQLLQVTSNAITPACGSGVGYTQSISSIPSSRQFEFAQPDTYLVIQTSHSSQPFQQGVSSVQHTPSHPLPLQTILSPLPSAQIPSNHPAYVKAITPMTPMTPITQQHLQKQKQYNSYTLSSLPHGQRQYGIEEQWRPHSCDGNPENSGAWMASARTSSCSVAPFVQDGYFKSNFERGSSSSMLFPPPHNSTPSGTSLPGQSFPQMMSRPDFPTINFWRPT